MPEIRKASKAIAYDIAAEQAVWWMCCGFTAADAARALSIEVKGWGRVIDRMAAIQMRQSQ